MEREYKSYLDSIKDPELKRKLTPDYNLGCIRIPKSDKNYYDAVQLPNAHIVKGEIARIVPDGVVIADGTHVALDLLACATGFELRSASAIPVLPLSLHLRSDRRDDPLRQLIDWHRRILRRRSHEDNASHYGSSRSRGAPPCLPTLSAPIRPCSHARNGGKSA
jgi:hypothetical protein